MSLWWAGLCQGVCIAANCVLRKTLSSLSADGWGCVPALLVVWPEASQHWSLQAVGWGQVLERKWQPPGGLKPMSSPQDYQRQYLCPRSEPQHPAASTGVPPVLAGRSGPVFYEITAFFPRSWCSLDLVYALQEWCFCFPLSYGIPVIKPT